MSNRRTEYIGRNVAKFFVLFFLVLIFAVVREVNFRAEGRKPAPETIERPPLARPLAERAGGATVLPGEWTAAPVAVDPAKTTLPRFPAVIDPNPYSELLSVPANVRSDDGATFLIGRQTYKIAQVSTLPSGAICTNANGSRWACGQRARMALRLLIMGKTLQCRPIAKGLPEVTVDCRLGSESIATALIRAGWALPRDVEDASLGKALAESQSKKAGAWVGVGGVRP